MRLDQRPTVPEVRAAFLAYEGSALRPFVEARAVTAAVLEECEAIAVERRDPEGLRLALRIRRLSGDQKRGLRASLREP